MSINKSEDIPNALTVKTSHYLIASLSLITALSWNEAMSQSIKKIYTIPTDAIWANFLYSIFITVILIFVIYMLPNTTKELPAKTQAVIKESETAEEITIMKEEMNGLRADNHVLKFQVGQVIPNR